LGKEKWETPIGQVTEGFEDVVKKFYSYGDMPPWGKGPTQGKIHAGPSYIEDNFPLTDKFMSCKVQRHNSNADVPAEESGERQVSDHLKDWHREEWKTADSENVKPGAGGLRLKEKFRKLTSQVQEKASNSTDSDLIALGGILIVIVIATFILATLKSKKKAVGKKS